jgi:hypothetical protein
VHSNTVIGLTTALLDLSIFQNFEIFGNWNYFYPYVRRISQEELISVLKFG